jgi:dTDP-4-amino-4,6-dideoxygalactose transaminase
MYGPLSTALENLSKMMVKKLKSKSDRPVPFNDLTRIHEPLLPEFAESLNRLVTTSSLVLGEELKSFEQELAVAEDSNFAVGVNNGTNAIELALRALGIQAGDEVIVPAFTFVATAFAVTQIGAIPVLVDVCENTGLLDLDSAQEAISEKTKALILVTIHGRTDHLNEYRDFCEQFNISFVIDGAQSHLSTFDGNKLINFCDVSTLSFYPGKNLGALGEGGAVLTNSEEINSKLRLMRDWGAERKYDHSTWGGNFRLEPLQASFLKTKLRKLQKWTDDRIRIASIYRNEMSRELLMDQVSQKGSHVFHIFALKVENRESVEQIFNDLKISYAFHYPRAIHQNKAYIEFIKTPVLLKNSEKLASQTISLPIFPNQTESEIERVINAVNLIE